MLETEQITAIFADAWVLYEDALEELERGKLRNAAEKAGGATKRATGRSCPGPDGAGTPHEWANAAWNPKLA